MSEPWTIRRVVRWGAEDFAQRGIGSPRLDAELIVAHALGLTRVKLYMELDRELTAEELVKVRELVQRRRKREPVAYLVGQKEFWGRPFLVSAAVLVPRPDTETLVERALAILGRSRAVAVGIDASSTQVEARSGLETHVEADAPGQASVSGDVNGDASGDVSGDVGTSERAPAGPPLPHAGEGRGEGEGPERTGDASAPCVLDLCTGSGCIGLTLACELPLAAVTLADISSAALEVARRNADALARTDATLSSRVALAEGDLYAALPPQLRFELIACNPPYLAEAELAECEPDVRDHEPKLALVGGASGDEVIVRVADGARARLVPGGTLLVEIGVEQGARVRDIFAKAGLRDIVVHRDLSGRDRVVEGRAPAA